MEADPLYGASPAVSTPPSRAARQYPCPEGVAATATTGAARGMAPDDTDAFVRTVVDAYARVVAMGVLSAAATAHAASVVVVRVPSRTRRCALVRIRSKVAPRLPPRRLMRLPSRDRQG